MPLYVQNGNLLNKAGTLGTSAGCCCYPPPPPPPKCFCNCAEGGFDFCDPYEVIFFNTETNCPGFAWPNQYDLPCFNLVLGGFADVKLYFGTTAQGYPFSRQWLKDEALETYDGQSCSFAIHMCYRQRYATSRCMRDGVCICLNTSGVTTEDWHVWFFDCNLEAWIDVTGDILTTSRAVAFSPGFSLGPENNCSDCEWDNGNPPPVPAEPDPCGYDITTGPCKTITGNFP
jgi:hypothetical protein